MNIGRLYKNSALLEGVRDGWLSIVLLNPTAEAQISARVDSILHRTAPPVPTIG